MTFAGIARELGALVVDFLDVALGAGRADDVLGRGSPSCSSQSKRSSAHAGRQHGDAAAAEDARDRDAAAAIIPGRGPHRLVAPGSNCPRDQARHEASVSRQHLVRADHREAAAERQEDARLHAGERLGQLEIGGYGCQPLAALRRCTNARGRDCRPRPHRRRWPRGPPTTRAGMRAGSASSAKLGSTTRAWRRWRTARARRVGSTTSVASSVQAMAGDRSILLSSYT